MILSILRSGTSHMIATRTNNTTEVHEFTKEKGTATA
jgi:hypothetical protein